MTRRKSNSKFKTKVILESLKERHTLAELGQKCRIHPMQISAWKRDFLDGAVQVFEAGNKDNRSDAEKKNDQLLKTIGELKVENDLLKDALR